MKKCLVMLSIVSITLFGAFKNGGDSTYFFTLVENGGLQYVKPSSAKDVKVVQNADLNYHYAVRDTVDNIEIRYIVYPLQEAINQYNGPHSDSGVGKIDPNFLHTNFLLSCAFKVEGKAFSADGQFPEIKELSHATADIKYNADWVGIADVQPCDEFGQQYKFCTICALHKDNLADVFIFYLYNNKDEFTGRNPFAEETVDGVFNSLKFKKK
jgi:hypothetical protein